MHGSYQNFNIRRLVLEVSNDQWFLMAWLKYTFQTLMVFVMTFILTEFLQMTTVMFRLYQTQLFPNFRFLFHGFASVFINNSTTGGACGAGTAYSIWEYMLCVLNSGFTWVLCCPNVYFLCSVLSNM